MAMDWTGDFMRYSKMQAEVEDDEEDFYSTQQQNGAEADGNGPVHAVAGAPEEEPLVASLQSLSQSARPVEQTQQRVALAAEVQKREDHLAVLRSKLIEKKKKTKKGLGPRPKTPAKESTTSTPAPEQQKEAVPVQKQQQADTPMVTPGQEPSDIIDSVTALLAESEEKAALANAHSRTAATPANTPHVELRFVAPKEQQILSREQFPAESEANQPAGVPTSAAKPKPVTAVHQVTRSRTNLSDPYYKDLAIWLEMTGYHDVTWRESKLATYKERRELETEQARIAEKLERIKQIEQANIVSLRTMTTHPISPAAPPPLPTSLPFGENNVANGHKRHRSPDSVAPEKRRTEGPGFQFRGADDAARRPSSPTDRRISLPDRRGSFEDGRDRDPSLERRQRFYKHDDERGPPRHGGPWDGAREQGRPPIRQLRDGRNYNGGYNNNRGYESYRGSSALALPKGGVRYFMIKSWNHENVNQSMNDGLWATQEKNEQLLTEAFHNSRHVILLFSVNRSMAFQGYALMTSSPDPSLPKPSFCQKLNWGTSPAFSVRWLAKTPVHFRLVGHLKNTCNPDETGTPRAVLVGKDGQEISQDAGLGTVTILDHAEAAEGYG